MHTVLLLDTIIMRINEYFWNKSVKDHRMRKINRENSLCEVIQQKEVEISSYLMLQRVPSY